MLVHTNCANNVRKTILVLLLLLPPSTQPDTTAQLLHVVQLHCPTTVTTVTVKLSV